MTWTAPTADRSDPPFIADERKALDSLLDYHRQTLLMKCAGLTDAQLRTPAAPPSSMTLLGIVRHMAAIERWAFRVTAGGEDLPDLYCTDDDPDAEFDGAPASDAATDLATWHAEVAAGRVAMAGRSLDETFFYEDEDTDASFRWVYLHVIEEYARHNGHADLLRERIDGATGT